MALEVKAWRRLKNITQAQMAENLGLSTNGYANLEANPSQFRMETAYKFASVIGVDISEIIFLPESGTK